MVRGQHHGIRFVSAVCALALATGCADDPPSGAEASLGGKAVTKYVAVGNSLTAGYQSNALYASAQQYSYPKLIAGQLARAGAPIGTFEQPTYGDPGNPAANGLAARFELISILGPVIGPRGLTPGSPTNTALARPYDNLGLPGAPLAGFLDTTGSFHGSFGSLVLRSSGGFPKSPFAQVQTLNPDLITFWLGANDVLGYATSGGVSPSAPTPASTFSALYTQSLGALRTAYPSAIILVATIPDVAAIPFFTTLAGNIRANPMVQSAFAAGGSFRFQKAGELGAGSGTSKLEPGAGTPLVTLLGGLYAFSLGLPTYAPYRSLGPPYDNYAFAASMGIDSTQPFGLHPANPFPGAFVLDSSEQAVAREAVGSYNATIKSVAAANNATVWDAHGLFEEVKKSGYTFRGVKFTADFVVGGLFSLDGVHPSSRGYGIVANEMLKTLNQTHGMRVPLVDILSIPGIDAPALSKAGATGYPALTGPARDELLALFGARLVR